MQALLEKENKLYNKISKPDFTTKTGREFLAFFLQTKFKQIMAYDKKSENPIILGLKQDFISKFTRRIINNPEKRILVGICGESSSGKTTICNTIKHTANSLSMPVEVISSDNYFNDISELISVHGGFDALLDSGFDIDSPQNFQLDLLKADLIKLSQGTDVNTPEYLINGSGVSVPESIKAEAKKIVVVEGLAAVYGDVPDVFDVRVYVDIDKETQRKWFIKRAASRNQSEENALKQLAYVKNAAEQYILPQKEKSDIIINGTASLEYFKQILEYIHTITNCFEVEEI